MACVHAVEQSDNQTPDVNPIYPNQFLSFGVRVELEDYTLPNGIHSFVQATHGGKWLFLAGRTNGLHGFGPGNNNFPPSTQNLVVYVVDSINKTVYSRALTDPSSGLSLNQIDTLSVTSPQYYTSGSTLYITGGYGVDSVTGFFSTKNVLTAIDIPGLMHWVMAPGIGETAAQHIRQIFHPIFQVTGGYMTQLKNRPTLLVVGQNFEGFYQPDSNGLYSDLIRRFNIKDDGKNLCLEILNPEPHFPQEWLRRRDLNVVPIIHYERGKHRQKLIAFSGVFTEKGGIWTIPIVINSKGKPQMVSPEDSTAFKQGMNNYVCPTIGLFSDNSHDMYTIFFGGISFGYYDINGFQTDSEIPFINQITTIKYDKYGYFAQYLMDAEYPVILSTQSNPGKRLLFGAGAVFIPVEHLETYGGEVLNFDALNHTTHIGYIIGGIQSTLPNTSSPSDSAASPYIFKVFLTKD